MLVAKIKPRMSHSMGEWMRERGNEWIRMGEWGNEWIRMNERMNERVHERRHERINEGVSEGLNGHVNGWAQEGKASPWQPKGKKLHVQHPRCFLMFSLKSERVNKSENSGWTSVDRSTKATLSTYNTWIQISRLQKIYHFQSLKLRFTSTVWPERGWYATGPRPNAWHVTMKVVDNTA